MKEKKKVATTVKVEEQLYNDFKVLGIRHKLTLQGLIERAIYRYVNEEDFRKSINNFSPPVLVEFALSGSQTA
jgi:predicted DNA-binding ribbon-helix-helix protein